MTDGKDRPLILFGAVEAPVPPDVDAAARVGKGQQQRVIFDAHPVQVVVVARRSAAREPGGEGAEEDVRATQVHGIARKQDPCRALGGLVSAP